MDDVVIAISQPNTAPPFVEGSMEVSFLKESALFVVCNITMDTTVCQ